MFYTHVPCISYIKMYYLPVIIHVIKIKTNEMIEACGRYGGGDRYMQSFGGEVWVKIDHWEDVDVVGKIILKCILKESIERAWIVFIWLRVETEDGL